VILIVGANSNLAKAIASVSSEETLAISRNEYEDWHIKHSSGGLKEFFLKREKTISRVFITAGITDPTFDTTKLKEVNFDLPLQIAKVASQLGIPVMTFGTVAETFNGPPNHYVASKIALSNEIARNGYFDNLVHHFRLHTLFGGQGLKKHMFLGQIIESILHNEEFHMSAGNQIREYHHVEDIAKIICERKLHDNRGSSHISHGKPHRLIDVASSIFGKYGDLKNLKVGKLDFAQAENFESRFEPWPPDAESSVRSSLEEIGKYVEMQIEKGREVN